MSRIKKKIFSPNHAEPGDFWLDYILLPYGEYYDKTRVFLEAKEDDTLHFFEGPDYAIKSVYKIKQDKVCDFLCRMRYGIPWERAFKKWQSYAVLEGHGRDILSKEFCLLVIYKKNEPLSD